MGKCIFYWRNNLLMRLLIRFPNWVGDIVMATPVLKVIRNNFPDAHISAVIRKYAIGILEPCPYVDSLIPIDDKNISGLLNLSAIIKKGKYDKAILLTNSPRAFFSVFFAGIKEIYGYRRNIQKYFINGPSPRTENGKIKAVPMTEYYLQICRYMGLNIYENTQTELFVSPEAEEKIERIFREKGVDRNKKIICINPGAKFGSSKCWAPANFAKLADFAAEEFSAQILLITGPSEEKIASEILSKVKKTIIYLPDINLSELKSLIKRVNLLVTNDTGPRHYATAFNIPAVVIIGSTDYRYTDYRRDISSFVKVELDCAPCHLKECPRDHECMVRISPEMVLAHIRNFLAR